MLRVGLTGGIGAGKSAVAARLRELGAVVIDSDVVAREVVAPGTPGLAAVAEAFGADVLRADGSLDRARLGALVFADDAYRRRLEQITHPLIAERAAQLAHGAAADAVVVQDVPLLVEKDMAGRFDVVVVVQAPRQVRLERLRERGLPEAEATARMAAQASDDDRRAVADVVIDNGGTRESLHEQVDRLWARLRKRSQG
ncbi:dephospho-CoA kinase [Angustibacter sp. McL0619]|uniref:dephospho-CoA kinase n=1 Tax=Angustibacter sp. McL0619 TaxID=3415676 RepID=UPI003CF8E89B